MGQGMERFMLAGHNLGLDLMRATEAAALAAGRWAGRGDKESGDKAAVDAMRAILNQVRMAGTSAMRTLTPRTSMAFCTSFSVRSRSSFPSISLKGMETTCS